MNSHVLILAPNAFQGWDGQQANSGSLELSLSLQMLCFLAIFAVLPGGCTTTGSYNGQWNWDWNLENHV